MPGTGHSHRYKGSISNRVRKSPFQQLAEWNAQLLGADGAVPSITGGGGGLAFKKLDASDIDGVMHNPATEDLDMNSFNIISNGVLDISAAGLTLSSASDINIEATGTMTITANNGIKIDCPQTSPPSGNIIIGEDASSVKIGWGNASTGTTQPPVSKIGFFGVAPITRPTITRFLLNTAGGGWTVPECEVLAESINYLINLLDEHHGTVGGLYPGLGLVYNGNTVTGAHDTPLGPI